MSDLWTTASQDAENQEYQRTLTAARLAVAPLWPFLAKAESANDFLNRRELIAEQLEAALAPWVGDDERLAARVREDIAKSLEHDFNIVQIARREDISRTAESQYCFCGHPKSSHHDGQCDGCISDDDAEADPKHRFESEDAKSGSKQEASQTATPFGRTAKTRVEESSDEGGGYYAYCPEHDWAGTKRDDQAYAQDDADEHEREEHSKTSSKTAASCDYGHEAGEVRSLPIGGDSNAIVCKKHYDHEMAFRKERNKDLSTDAKFEFPKWEDLKPYKESSLVVEAVAWARRHYEDLASFISSRPDRAALGKHFAEHLKGTNPNYRPEQFEKASTSEGYSVRGGTASANYSRGHLQHIAEGIKSYSGDKKGLAESFADHLSKSVPNFKRDRFLKASEGKTAAKMQAWDVYLNGEEIDTIFYTDDMDEDEVKKSLVDHDGYDPGITVKKSSSLKRKHAEEQSAAYRYPEGSTATCAFCGQPILLDQQEGGGPAKDWGATPDQWQGNGGIGMDYGCGDNPENDDEGTGGHLPRRGTIRGPNGEHLGSLTKSAITYSLGETETVYRSGDTPAKTWYVVADMPDGQKHQVTAYDRDRESAQRTLEAIQGGDLSNTFPEHRARVQSSLTKGAPYGIPKEKGGDSEANDKRMEDCVKKVKAKGNVDNAYAVCKASLGFTKGSALADGHADALAGKDLGPYYTYDQELREGYIEGFGAGRIAMLKDAKSQPSMGNCMACGRPVTSGNGYRTIGGDVYHTWHSNKSEQDTHTDRARKHDRGIFERQDTDKAAKIAGFIVVDDKGTKVSGPYDSKEEAQGFIDNLANGDGKDVKDEDTDADKDTDKKSPDSDKDQASGGDKKDTDADKNKPPFLKKKESALNPFEMLRNPYDKWMVKKNLDYVKEEGVETVVNRLRAGGYDKVADALQYVVDNGLQFGSGVNTEGSRKTAEEGQPPTLYPDSDCRLVFEGHEPEVGDWYHCLTHDELTLEDQVPCEKGSFGPKEGSRDFRKGGDALASRVIAGLFDDEVYEREKADNPFSVGDKVTADGEEYTVAAVNDHTYVFTNAQGNRIMVQRPFVDSWMNPMPNYQRWLDKNSSKTASFRDKVREAGHRIFSNTKTQNEFDEALERQPDFMLDYLSEQYADAQISGYGTDPSEDSLAESVAMHVYETYDPKDYEPGGRFHEGMKTAMQNPYDKLRHHIEDQHHEWQPRRGTSDRDLVDQHNEEHDFFQRQLGRQVHDHDPDIPKKFAANPYMPGGNPYAVSAPPTPGTPDDMLEGPPPSMNDYATPDMIPPVTTKPRQMPNQGQGDSMADTLTQEQDRAPVGTTDQSPPKQGKRR